MSNKDYELRAEEIRSWKLEPDNNEMNNCLGIQKD
jgi:hypothetical protein